MQAKYRRHYLLTTEASLLAEMKDIRRAKKPVIAPPSTAARVTLPVLVSALIIALISGCHSEFFPGTSRAPAEVVVDMRATGKLVAETTTEWYWDGLTEITDVLVIDTGAANTADARASAMDTLKKRGWKLDEVDFPSPSVFMKSGKWREVELSIDSLPSYDPPSSDGLNEELDKHNEQLFRALNMTAGAENLVVLQSVMREF